MNFKDSYGVLQLSVNPKVHTYSIFSEICCFFANWHMIYRNNLQKAYVPSKKFPGIFNVDENDPLDFIYHQYWSQCVNSKVSLPGA
jgi:hypothetical protein